jgi:Integrase core domain
LRHLTGKSFLRPDHFVATLVQSRCNARADEFDCSHEFQTWRTFLTNHVACAPSMDFVTVPTITGRVLFVLVVLSHYRRRIVHVNITDHPTATWSAQQVVDACPDDTAPRWLHRDRDRIYGAVFQRRLVGMGIAEVVSATASPWQNPYGERAIGSIRRECLDHVVVVNAVHLRRVLTSYRRYYHRSRTHLGLEKDTPDHRPVSETSTGTSSRSPKSVVSITALNGTQRKRPAHFFCNTGAPSATHYPCGVPSVIDTDTPRVGVAGAM